ncbi:MAG: GtrA family protein [Lewinellaceae bacterium]|nr:GtrA family protein [Lewinellaceae bacterium]
MRSSFHILGKYGLSSIGATSVDFSVFQVALAAFFLPAVQATVLGRCAGTLVAFWMHRRWVFRHSNATNWWALRVKYGSGVLLGMGLNVSGVWLLHDLSGWSPWPARIAAALACWFLLFLFNRYVVFQTTAEQQPRNQRI